MTKRDGSKGKNTTDIGKSEGVGLASSRGPWTAKEEEMISMLMELMPLLAEANVAARRRRYRRKDGPHEGQPPDR